MSQETLLLIDGFNLLSRGHFATAYGRTEDQLKNSKGVYTNALRVFFQKLFNLARDYQVTHLAVAWDVKRNESTRRMQHDFYKATRSELPEPMIQQYGICRGLLEHIGIPQLCVAPYEADDIIGTLSRRWSRGKCLIYSNDRDLLQLLSDNTSQIIAGKKGENVYSHDDFQQEYGITSSQWVDVKALLGDTSDNIPGCPGIGEKSALPLIRHYGSLENIYEQIDELDPQFNRSKKKLAAGKDSAYISKQLSAIICNIAELEHLSFDDLALHVSKDTLIKELMKLELKINVDHWSEVS